MIDGITHCFASTQFAIFYILQQQCTSCTPWLLEVGGTMKFSIEKRKKRHRERRELKDIVTIFIHIVEQGRVSFEL